MRQYKECARTHNLNAKYVECAHDVIGHPPELPNFNVVVDPIVKASVSAWKIRT